jgi:hypothetical protein
MLFFGFFRFQKDKSYAFLAESKMYCQVGARGINISYFFPARAARTLTCAAGVLHYAKLIRIPQPCSAAAAMRETQKVRAQPLFAMQ